MDINNQPFARDIRCCGNVKVGNYVGRIRIYTNPDKSQFWLGAEHTRRSLRFNRYDEPILKAWKRAVDDAPPFYACKLISLENYNRFVDYQLSVIDKAINEPPTGLNLPDDRTRLQQTAKTIAGTQKSIHEFVDTAKRQDLYKHEEPIMKNDCLLRETKRITTPNGTTMLVFTDGVNEFVKTTTIARALGYSAFVVDNSLLALVFKNTCFHLYTKSMQGGKPTYFNKTTQVVPILQAFIRLALMTRQTNPAYLAKIDDARMEAERLIPVFKREVLGEPCTGGTYTKAVFVPGENQNPVQEVKQMQNDTTIQITVPPVTVMDIEDIGERADAVVKVFGVSKINALRAVTQLKAQEINRDLQPILDLLAVN